MNDLPQVGTSNNGNIYKFYVEEGGVLNFNQNDSVATQKTEIPHTTTVSFSSLTSLAWDALTRNVKVVKAAIFFGAFATLEIITIFHQTPQNMCTVPPPNLIEEALKVTVFLSAFLKD